MSHLQTLNCSRYLAVMGNQYNTLAHMLLVVHDPTIPQLGPSHKQSRAVVDVRHPSSISRKLLTLTQKLVQEDVRKLCGVAHSNLKVFPCIFVACYAIALGRYTHPLSDHVQ